MKKIQLIFLFTIITLGAFAQEELMELKYNAALMDKESPVSNGLRSVGISFKNPYFIIDTLSIPFIDDFSNNRLLSDDISLYPSSAISDSVAYNFKVNGIVVDSVKYMLDTSWTYTFNSSTNSYDSTAKTPFTVTKYENPSEPFIATSNLTVWPEYMKPVYDSTGIFINYENVAPDEVLYIEIDTIKVVQASAGDALWIDQNVFINRNYPINPPTIGVATFDGLRTDGRPYDPNQPQSQGPADTLTSKPLDLNFPASDSIYLSFYYQPQGLGNSPDVEDSLLLEFFSIADSSWQWQWSTVGSLLDDFKQVMIPIIDDKFLKKGFQFRFVNYATLAGNLDHWHIDYVKLNKNRTIADTLPNDVAFVKQANILLQNYQEMPWRQFVASPDAEMNKTLKVDMGNNSNASKVVTYTYDIRDKNNNLLITNGGLNGNEQANSDFSYSNNLNFVFPSSSESYERFEVLNTIEVPVIGDDIRLNDTIRQFQKFDHHYAYDDGSAEAAYGLSATGAKMACQFILNTADTLTAVAIHFAQVNQDVSFYSFKLTVWSSLSPETIVYQSEAFEYPVYESRIDGYHVYQVSPFILPAGNFYVGMLQTSNVKLNVGFDKNTDASSRMFFNISGAWETTQFSGSWMIRPVLGTSVLPVGIKNYNLQSGSLADVFSNARFYPNPSSGIVHLEGIANEINYSITVFDIFGREVADWKKAETNQLDFSSFASGIYLVKLTDKNTQLSKQTKIVVTK